MSDDGGNISRSGRVRKKSSKLADFQSPDDLDPRYKRMKKLSEGPLSPESEKQILEAGKCAPQVEDLPPAQLLASEDPVADHFFKAEMDLKLDDDDVDIEAADLDIKEEDFDDIPDIIDDDMDDVEEDEALEAAAAVKKEEEVEEKPPLPPPPPQASTASSSSSAVAPSSSSSSSSGATVAAAGGGEPKKVKTARKDKGKSRFTAYMLWAKHVRQEILRQNPEMDFATVSRRLGELWATVPSTEKYNWKRRARRLAARGLTAKGVLAGPGKVGVNIKTGSAAVAAAVGGGGTAVGGGAAVGRGRAQLPSQLVQQVARPQRQAPPLPPSLSDQLCQAGAFKVVGTEPIDVAAHLKLLGESLSVIGERLTEHEGQIAVSGSLSVLLDSMLCAMGPLMCLTQKVPELNGSNPETLNKILDNVAYIMPGL